ncbi:hypothetical protein [Mycobacteroides abscessus]|nr:hypothetical protein [Mycobacteroides abscessus]
MSDTRNDPLDLRLAATGGHGIRGFLSITVRTRTTSHPDDE